MYVCAYVYVNRCVLSLCAKLYYNIIIVSYNDKFNGNRRVSFIIFLHVNHKGFLLEKLHLYDAIWYEAKLRDIFGMGFPAYQYQFPSDGGLESCTLNQGPAYFHLPQGV